MKKSIISLTLLIVVIPLAFSNSINFGVGWNMGLYSNYGIKLGYSGDVFNIDWIFNLSKNYDHKIFLDINFENFNNLSFNPILFINNTTYFDEPLSIEAGLKLIFRLKNVSASFSLTYPLNPNYTYSIEKYIIIGLTYIVPPPTSKKTWKDELFINILYSKETLFIGVGLAEPL